VAPIAEDMSARDTGRTPMRYVMRPFALLLALASFTGAAFGLHLQAVPQQAAPDSSAITPGQVDLGRAIFHGQGTCFACHGQKLEGSQIAPTLMPHAWRDAKNGDFPAIYYVATHGVRSTLMVAYPGGISPEQALAVASYVWSVSRGRTKP